MELLEVIQMREANYKVPDGKLVKVKLEVASGRIAKVKILGDFFLHPEETIFEIEESLIGHAGDIDSIKRSIAQKLADVDATLIGATAADIAKAIMLAWEAK